MPRPPRVDFAGAWHHVMNRGADHRDIFEHDADREVFLDSLAEASDRAAFDVCAYCLMSNHYHLLVESREGNLAAGMQFLAGRFTRLVNLRVGRDGPLFRGRYVSVGINSTAHRVQACRYIHLNPVVAGLKPSAEAWPWSSAAAYIGSVQPPPWLKTHHILELFGPRDHLKNYCDFMNSAVDEQTATLYAELGW